MSCIVLAGVEVAGVCSCSTSVSPSALGRFSTPTLGIKKKLLMSLVQLPWESVANESLGFPLTFAELRRPELTPDQDVFPTHCVAVATPVTNP